MADAVVLLRRRRRRRALPRHGLRVQGASQREPYTFLDAVGLYIPEIEFLIDNLLVRVDLIIVMIRWTGLAPSEFEFPFLSSLISTFLDAVGPCTPHPANLKAI